MINIENIRNAGIAALTFTLAANTATAQLQQCYTDDIPLMTTSWSEQFVLPQFDPSQGVLLGIDLTFTVHIEGSANVESLDAVPTTVTLDYAATIGLLDPGGASLATLTPTQSFVDNLGSFDGTVDFAGPSGTSHPGIVLNETTAISSPPGPLSFADFVGAGNVSLDVGAVGSSQASGSGNLVTQFQTSASASVQLCYNYAVDCNQNGVPDDQDIATGVSTDCNQNGVPDECEPDCDADGIPDDCEEDCNSNGTPDDCEVLPDCNQNGVPDDCEAFADCNQNGVPDECEPDCDADGTPDGCETDCNLDGIPDECQDLTDCNNNGIPDECEGPVDCGCSEGCTPGYWKNHYERWDRAGDDDFTISVHHFDSFNGSFGVTAAESGLADSVTLGEAADLGGGGLAALNRHAAAALPDSDAAICYGHTSDEVIAIYRDGVGADPGPLDYGSAKDLLEAANEAGCPLSNDTPPVIEYFCVAEQDDCPCDNDVLGGGCANSTGLPGLLSVSGTSSVAADDLMLHADQLPPDQMCLFFAGSTTMRVPFGDGLLCLDPTTKLLRFNPPQTSSASGSASVGPDLVFYLDTTFGPPVGDVDPGETWFFQCFYRDPGGPCATGFSLTSAVGIPFTP